MALPQQGTETLAHRGHTPEGSVLMALPQQGTETLQSGNGTDRSQICSVNGLTPTGDGNKLVNITSIAKSFIMVLMALPQQGTETSQISCNTSLITMC